MLFKRFDLYVIKKKMELGIFFSILRISYKYLCIMEVLILEIFIIKKMFHSSKCVIMYNIL